jgi:hypothetical protein
MNLWEIGLNKLIQVFEHTTTSQLHKHMDDLSGVFMHMNGVQQWQMDDSGIRVDASALARCKWLLARLKTLLLECRNALREFRTDLRNFCLWAPYCTLLHVLDNGS